MKMIRIGRNALFSRQWALDHLLPMLPIVVAFALRLYQLEGQSMWSDEGLSLYRARQSLAEILANTITVDGIDTRDTNPPLYFLLLHFWRALVGEQVFLLRFPGVLVGVLAIPLMYQLGSRAFSRRVGLVAALLMAFSPFHVWQTQVLRNYGLLLTLNLLAIYGLYRFVLRSTRRRWGWLLLWLVVSLLQIYTHYFGFLIFAYTLLALFAFTLRRMNWRQWLRQWRAYAVLGCGLLVLIPAFLLALERFRAGRQVDFHWIPVSRVAAHAAGAFSVGMSPSLSHPGWRVWPVVALALIGIWLGWRRHRAATLLLLGYQFVPLGLLLALSTINPLYNGTRHLLIGLPPYLMLLAVAIAVPSCSAHRTRWQVWGRRLGLTLGALFLVTQILWLWTQFHTPAFIRDDVRGAALYLNKVVGPDDVIILHDTLIDFTFDYYYDGAAPVVAIPQYGEQDVAAATAALEAAGQSAARVWFLSEPTPRTGFDRDVLVDWADRHWMRVADHPFPSMWLRVRMRTYVPAFQAAALPPTAEPAEVRWRDGWRLHGYEMPQTITAGEEWWPTFYLSKEADVERQYSFSLHLLDEQNQEWVQLNDVVDGGGIPPAAWPTGAMIRYLHDVQVPAGLPPGRYQVWLHLVYTENGETIPLEDGSTRLRLPDVEIRAAAPSCDVDEAFLPPHTPRRVRLGRDVELRGYVQPSGEYRPGHVLWLDLLWCARHKPRADYRVQLQLLNADDEVVGESEFPLTRSHYPPTQWREGELILSKAPFLVPATAEAGPHTLRLTLLPPDDGKALSVTLDRLLPPRFVPLGNLTVKTWPMETEFPTIAMPLRADFGDPTLVELHGYELSPAPLKPGESFELTLFWRSVTNTMRTNYSVFIHGQDETGAIPISGDDFPMRGFRPTTSWRIGEVFVDERVITIPADAPPGTYELWIGFYNRDTGERLPAKRNGERQPDNRILLQTISVAP